MPDTDPKPKFSLKDHLFNADKIGYLADLFAAADAGFNRDGFYNDIMVDLMPLELMARINLISVVLEKYLPAQYDHAVASILKSLPAPLDPTKQDDDFGDFIFAPLGAFVARNGLNDLDVSLPALRELTKRFSVEFDIRHFLNAHPEQTLAALKQWANDESYHVRRLVSEGTRPSLPWGKKLNLEYKTPMPFLDALYGDKTRFVTRSVANHLNDIAKRDPDLVVDTLKRWQAQGGQSPKEMAWMTSHALRVLVKKGHQGALDALGYHANPKITVAQINFPAQVEIGSAASFDVSITGHADEKLMVDFVIDFVKKNGTTSPKVFKLKKLAIKRGETVTLTKTHRFLKNATTFTHYAGAHKIYMQINGKKHTAAEFELV